MPGGLPIHVFPAVGIGCHEDLVHMLFIRRELTLGARVGSLLLVVGLRARQVFCGRIVSNYHVSHGTVSREGKCGANTLGALDVHHASKQLCNMSRDKAD